MRTARTTTLLATIGIGAALVLSACTEGPDVVTTPTASSTPTTSTTPSATSTPSATAPQTPSSTPRPTSTITPVPGVDYDGGTVPSECSDLITAGKWKFAEAPLNDPKVVGDSWSRPKDAFTSVLQADGKHLSCVWRDPRADITNLVIDVVVVDSSRAFGALQALPAKGYDCAHVAEGYRCQKVSQNSQYPVIDGDTYFTRGDIGIRISQSNTPTDGLLDDVTAHVFG